MQASVRRASHSIRSSADLCQQGRKTVAEQRACCTRGVAPSKGSLFRSTLWATAVSQVLDASSKECPNRIHPAARTRGGAIRWVDDTRGHMVTVAEGVVAKEGSALHHSCFAADGPLGSTWLLAPCSVPNQAAHQSQALPEKEERPPGALPCQVFHYACPSGAAINPWGELLFEAAACRVLPLCLGEQARAGSGAASLSVVREMYTTEWSTRVRRSDPDPSGARKVAPGTLHHQSVTCTVTATARLNVSLEYSTRRDRIPESFVRANCVSAITGNGSAKQGETVAGPLTTLQQTPRYADVPSAKKAAAAVAEAALHVSRPLESGHPFCCELDSRTNEERAREMEQRHRILTTRGCVCRAPLITSDTRSTSRVEINAFTQRTVLSERIQILLGHDVAFPHLPATQSVARAGTPERSCRQRATASRDHPVCELPVPGCSCTDLPCRTARATFRV